MTIDLWAVIHQARAELAADLDGLAEEQWRSASLCGGWTVEQVVAHLTAAASLGRAAWLRSMLLSGFRPTVHNQRRLREHQGATPAETLARFRAVVPATIAPTKDLPAYLGEVLVHGEDIRTPLGLPGSWGIGAATAVAEFYASRNFTVDSRTLASGVELIATDGPFRTGTGPEVTGPTHALVMTLAGRRSHLDHLDGAGVRHLTGRLGRSVGRRSTGA